MGVYIQYTVGEARTPFSRALGACSYLLRLDYLVDSGILSGEWRGWRSMEGGHSRLVLTVRQLTDYIQFKLDNKIIFEVSPHSMEFIVLKVGSIKTMST